MRFLIPSAEASPPVWETWWFWVLTIGVVTVCSGLSYFAARADRSGVSGFFKLFAFTMLLLGGFVTIFAGAFTLSTVNLGDTDLARPALTEQVADVYGVTVSEPVAEQLLVHLDAHGEPERWMGLATLVEGRTADTVERFGTSEVLVGGKPVQVQLAWLDTEWVLLDLTVEEQAGEVAELARS